MKHAIGSIISALMLMTLMVGCSGEPAAEAPIENPAGKEKTAPPISPGELMQRMAEQDNILILDVRTPDEYTHSHLPGAMNIPHTEIEARLSELPDDRSSEIVVHCKTGRRAGIARETLRNEGYTNVRDLSGHFAEWSALDLPLEQGPAP